MKKISDKLIGGLNRQITAEFESAYLYLAMASYLQAQSLNGMAHWFRVQADEEKRHALKINDFMVERNITPELGEIKAPSKQWQGVYDLVAQGMEDKDFASLSFLQWFVDEQVQEECQSLELLEKVRLIDDVTAGLMVLDQQMGIRQE